MDEDKDPRTEFSFRQGMFGVLVLRVKDYSTFQAGGEWRDASPKDLPLVFERLANGRKK